MKRFTGINETGINGTGIYGMNKIAKLAAYSLPHMECQGPI